MSRVTTKHNPIRIQVSALILSRIRPIGRGHSMITMALLREIPPA